MIGKISVFLLLGLIANLTLASHWSRGSDGGKSNAWRKQDGWGNYNFGYEIEDGKGATNSREETGDGWGNKKGSYSLKDVDGRWRTVVYTADKSGFRASIKTNEPGTGNLDAADAVYNGEDEHGGSYTNIISGHEGGSQGSSGWGQEESKRDHGQSGWEEPKQSGWSESPAKQLQLEIPSHSWGLSV